MRNGPTVQRPRAVRDTYTVQQDSAGNTMDVLSNDTGTDLSVAFLFEATQQGGQTSQADGVITYQAPAGFTGTDRFWYIATDGTGFMTSAKVTVEVEAVTTAETTEITDTTDVTDTTDTVEITDADATDTSETSELVDTNETTEVTSTEGIECDYVDSTSEDSASNEPLSATSESSWSCDSGLRTLTANGLPDHATGEFPSEANPNAIVAQTVSGSFPLEPTATDLPTQLGGPAGVIGFALNGIKIDPVTGGSCDDSGENCSKDDANLGQWSIEALGQTGFDFGLDENNGDVQSDGAYHYHGIPEGFLTKLGASDATMTLIGWAADGFPIYARHGYNDPNDPDSGTKVIAGSYQTVAPLADVTRPPEETYPLGTFTQDWEYVQGLGDLDECNGRFGVTPEFPNGIYHYYATDSYPYFQRCVKGEVEAPIDQVISTTTSTDL